ncbi:peptidase M48 family protein [Crucibulum laeve]|uniref:Peptidase M48 family protein n=1 Tax=Crucibulum laeve TaxID=68775 RepID=A0A5C3LHC8_9AGAR|nr:peptidase M48 family protein [Crucibulum laeve]
MFCRATRYPIFRQLNSKFLSRGPTKPTINVHNTIKRHVSTTRPRQDQYIRFGDIPPRPGGPPPPKRSAYQQLDTRVKYVIGFGIAGTIYYVAHLETVPQTGRWRFMNMGPKTEARIGELARAEMREQLGPKTLPINHPITRHVRRVVSRILTYSDLGTLSGDSTPRFTSPFNMSGGDDWTPDADFGASSQKAYGPNKEWDVIVVNDNKMINAMAVPGLVVVFTGILPVCQDEQGLAAVLAHEIGHVVARHTAERLSSQTIFFGFIILMQTLGVDYGISNIAQKLLLELPNSRTQEREADLIGLRLMSRACYNPQAAPEMFNRLGRVEAKLSSSMNLDFMRTHPSSANRVKYLEQALPEGYAILAENPDCQGMQEHYADFRHAAGAVPIKLDDQGGWSILR